MLNRKRPKGRVAAPDVRVGLSRAVTASSDSEVAAGCGFGVHTLARIIAGLEVYPTSELAARAYLERTAADRHVA